MPIIVSTDHFIKNFHGDCYDYSKAEVRQWKSLFIKFIKWYNRTNPSFSQQGKYALSGLHEVWKSLDEHTSLKMFWKLKTNHSVVSTDMYKLGLIDLPEWKSYIVYGTQFRTRLATQIHQNSLNH